MKKKPVVSVIMSVYNGEEHLQDAIESITQQTYTNYEFLIINDGSTDSSLRIIEAAKTKNPRIKIINQANKGLVKSLNIGISKAAGKYIARMDADDLSLSTRLEQQVQFLDSNPSVDIVGTGFIFFNSAEQELGKQGVLVEDADIKRELCLRNPYAHGSVMIRKIILEKCGVYSDRVGPLEDYELWLRIAKTGTLAGIPDFLYKWRISPVGISQTNAVYQLEKTAELAKEFRREYSPGISLRHLIQQKKIYKRLNAASYGRYMEDQYVFSKIYFSEHMFINAAITGLVITSSPKILLKEALKGVVRIKSRILSFLLRSLRTLR